MFGFGKNKVKLSFIYKNKSWLSNIPDIEKISERVLKNTFKGVGVKQVKGMEINILLTSDKEIQ